MYFDEDLILDLRLNTLNDHVDEFIIAEATRDHSGKEKKLNFNYKNFAKFRDKINYIIVDDLDIEDMVSDAGFDPTNTFEALAPSAYEAAEAKRTNLFQGGDFGGGGIWYLWGCRK